MTTQAERREVKRREKLDQIARQIADGSLQVRQMTPQERSEHPVREPPAGSRFRRAR